ncbi:MAG: hypothetical protein HY901_22420, partial [Deltaproteobacteria bacterium]|nr:hypothetical protein [Deltaproteobacteria bacterium]
TYTIRCKAPNWSWSLPLPAGTYDFRVSRGSYAAAARVNLLPLEYLAAEGVNVSEPLNDLVLDEEPGLTVSGMVTINGETPTKDSAYCSDSRNLEDSIAVVSFLEKAKGYAGTYTIRCKAPNWSWSLPLPAGTYDFRVSRGSYAAAAHVNLLPLDYLAAANVVIP